MDEFDFGSEEFYRNLDNEDLKSHLDFLTSEMRDARLERDVLLAEIAYKEHRCKQLVKNLESWKNEYDIVVEEMTTRNGD